MDSKKVYACTLCYETYDTHEEAVECAIEECYAVEMQYECAECETYWKTEKEANFCCSEEDTIDRRAQFDEALPEIDDIEGFGGVVVN